MIIRQKISNIACNFASPTWTIHYNYNILVNIYFTVQNKWVYSLIPFIEAYAMKRVSLILGSTL